MFRIWERVQNITKNDFLIKEKINRYFPKEDKIKILAYYDCTTQYM